MSYSDPSVVKATWKFPKIGDPDIAPQNSRILISDPYYKGHQHKDQHKDPTPLNP